MDNFVLEQEVLGRDNLSTYVIYLKFLNLI
jgi:hypothetical protein